MHTHKQSQQIMSRAVSGHFGALGEMSTRYPERSDLFITFYDYNYNTYHFKLETISLNFT